MSKSEAYSLFALADKKWFEELTRLFGKHKARTIAYTRIAAGEPGSNLRVLFDNKTLAREAWERTAFRPASESAACDRAVLTIVNA